MDRTQVEETKRQHRKKSSPVQPSRTKEEADQRTPGEEESSMGFTRSSSTGSCEVEAVHWWIMLHIRSDKGLSQVLRLPTNCIYVSK